MDRTMYKTVALLLAGVLLYAFPAAALGLDEARKNGMVGEQLDGYVAAINTGSGVVKLVAEINEKRKSEYTRIAKQNGQELPVVGQLAAPKIIEGLPKGALYQDNNGAWKSR